MALKKRSKVIQEKKPSLLFKTAEHLLNLVDRFRSAESKEKEQQQFRELYIGADCLIRGRAERRKRMATTLGILCVVIVLSLIAEGKARTAGIEIKDNHILRQENEPPLTLHWNAGGEEGAVSFALKPQRIPIPERETLFSQAEQYVRAYIQGANESLRALRGDLGFPEAVPGTEVTVLCQLQGYHWLNADGSRTKHPLPEEGAEERLTVRLGYYEEEREFTLELLLLPEGSETEQFQRKLEAELLQRVTDNTNPLLVLPEEIDGVAVSWSVEKESPAATILLLGFVAAACVMVSGKRRQEEQIRKREQELMADYPEVVSKFLLLLNAGLSSRNTWERIVADYRKSGRKRYLYEEMLLTLHEIENGISLARAYERFGKRCRLLPYLRFSGVLVQNLQKGTKGSLQLLEQEALAAFAERKEAAKRKGEEAGTKLLLPMFGMLAIVLIIVIFPAFTNF